MAGKAVLLTALAVLVGSGCGSTTAELPVRTEFDKNTNFQSWKTFRFSDAGSSGSDSSYPKYEQLIQNALIEELGKRGYTRLQDGTPDFRIAYEIDFRGDRTPQMTPKGGGPDTMGKSEVGTTPSGTLTIKMLDPLSSRILWSGHVTEIKMNIIDPQTEIKKAVWRVLVEFPPITG